MMHLRNLLVLNLYILSVRFQQKNGELKVFGIEGDVKFGLRTRYEWTALQEDCDAAVRQDRLKYRPAFQRVKLKNMEEEIGDWLSKEGKVRYGVMGSCPSQLGDDEEIMAKVRKFCSNYDNISVSVHPTRPVIKTHHPAPLDDRARLLP